MSTIFTVFAWFRHDKGTLDDLTPMPGLPIAARLPFDQYIADTQYFSDEMKYISGLALQFNDDVVAKTVTDQIRRISKDYDMHYEFKFCDVESKIDWLGRMGIEGRLLHSVRNPKDFDVVCETKDPSSFVSGFSGACDERDEILDDEPISKVSTFAFLLMLISMLIAAPAVGYLERGKADNVGHNPPPTGLIDKVPLKDTVKAKSTENLTPH